MSLLSEHKVNLYIKRDDLIHPIVSGNKWRKLKFNIELLLHNKKKGILTFGGAYSNHLVASAYACQAAGIDAIGIVRGEELNEQSNPTLKKMRRIGHEIGFCGSHDL